MYDRNVGDQVLSFGHEGVLYRRSFIMYDKQTDSLWVHTTGEAIRGPLKGKTLTFLPSVVMRWGRWKALHPDTTVLTGQRGSKFMGRFGLAEEPEKYGLSVGQGKAPKLYPIALLARVRAINDTHDGCPIVVLWDETSKTARAYDRGTHAFHWTKDQLVDANGAAWDLLRGVPLKGRAPALKEIPATTWLIQRWKGFYPRGAVYAAPKK